MSAVLHKNNYVFKEKGMSGFLQGEILKTRVLHLEGEGLL
jgi:hypothetical protein